MVEAAVEDLEVKQSVFAELSRLQPPTTLLATNTSSLDIDAIAEAVHDPERVIGLHFFNPAPVMRLVEVVHGTASAQTYVDFAADLVASWGKTPVHCASTPGFIVNRVARPFYGEGQRMLEEGLADAATIDACLRSAGFRMGPLELTDLIGQDVNLAVGTSVWERTGQDPRYAPVQLQRDLVEQGRLGRKTGRGHLHVCAGRSPDRGATPTSAASRSWSVARSAPTRSPGRSPCSSTRPWTSCTAARPARRTSTPPWCSARRTRRAPSPGGASSGTSGSAASSPELDDAYPGGRYRPSPALETS